jgi:HD-like signal output (HDOD) protein
MTSASLTDEVNKALKLLTEEIQSQKLVIPTPPDILVELTSIVRKPNFNVEEIVKLLQRDPNISGRIIRVANSVLFGGRQPATDVSSAVKRLGTKNIQNLVTGLTISQQFILSKTKGLEAYLQQAWDQSTHVAAIAYVLAKNKTHIIPDTALLAGLIHNIGMLPIYLRLHRIEALKGNPQLLKAVSEKAVAKLYPRAGKMICESWNFPSELSDAVAQIHVLETNSGSSITISDITCIALHLYQYQKDSALPLPIKVISSSRFKKLWPSLEALIEDMTTFAAQIDEVNALISNE